MRLMSGSCAPSFDNNSYYVLTDPGSAPPARAAMTGTFGGCASLELETAVLRGNQSRSGPGLGADRTIGPTTRSFGSVYSHDEREITVGGRARGPGALAPSWHRPASSHFRSGLGY